MEGLQVIPAWQPLVDAIRKEMDADEEQAKACVATDWRMPTEYVIVDRDVDGWRSVPDESRIFSVHADRYQEGMHAVRHDPDRVLRQLEKDRAFLNWISSELADDLTQAVVRDLLAAICRAYDVPVPEGPVPEGPVDDE